MVHPHHPAHNPANAAHELFHRYDQVNLVLRFQMGFEYADNRLYGRSQYEYMLGSIDAGRAINAFFDVALPVS